MKNLFGLVLALMLVGCAHAGTWYEVTVTVTNTPAEHDIFTRQGSDLLWTNSTAGSPATLILLGADIGESATNLYRQLTTYKPSGVGLIEMTDTNVIRMVSGTDTTLTVSQTGDWCEIASTTWTGDGRRTLMVPPSLLPNATRTNDYSEVINGINDYSQVALSPSATATENLVNTSTDQTVAGVKTFTGATVLENSGTLIKGGSMTNDVYLDRVRMVQNRGQWVFFSEFGHGLDVADFLLEIDGDGWPSIYFAVSDGAGGWTKGAAASLVPDDAQLLNALTADNRYAGLDSDNILTGRNRHKTIASTRDNYDTLADGNNAGLDFDDYSYVKLKAGALTAAFAICGIVAGEDGDIIRIQNSTSFNMTIANESGVDPTPANRILTNTGADRATTGNGFVTLIYDGEAARWTVMSFDP